MYEKNVPTRAVAVELSCVLHIISRSGLNQPYPVIYMAANPVRGLLDKIKIRGTSKKKARKLQREHQNKIKQSETTKERNNNTKHMPEKKKALDRESLV